MKTIIVATNNKGKAREFAEMFEPKGYQIKTLADYPDIGDIEENGKTFEENAIIKAETVSQKTGQMVIADDSGLVIDYLNGAPGIYSARYAGEEKNDEANIQKVLMELEGVPFEERSARFVCALALAIPGKKTITVTGTCEGRILTEKRGSNGFGYDPIFFVREKGKTMAELEPSEKNEISHRANALKKLEEIFGDIIEGV